MDSNLKQNQNVRKSLPKIKALKNTQNHRVEGGKAPYITNGQQADQVNKFTMIDTSC